MREELTRERLLSFMRELARTAPRGGSYRVYLVGGGTAVHLGWRQATIDIDLYADRDEVLRDIQAIKERLNINVEFARPEDFVPPLRGAARRHVFIDKIGSIAFHHYDPYSQLLAKVVRGFQTDVQDSREFIRGGFVDPVKFETLVAGIPNSAYARYPNLSRSGVEGAVASFLAEIA